MQRIVVKFIYADELKKLFNVYGHFYDLRIGSKVFKCRSLLEIVGREIDDHTKQLPDAVVIMMNPGSSRPRDTNYKEKFVDIAATHSCGWTKDVISTRPDNAQYQIMRVMLLQDWRFVRVLNLSDLRNGNSGNFSREFQKASELDGSHPHSIFHSGRLKEFRKSVETNNRGPVIAAWGNIGVLSLLAEQALDRLKDAALVGIRLSEPSSSFRYPSPYKKIDKLKWLKEIGIELQKFNEEIKTFNGSHL
jgi:hypothetical protein